MTSGAYFLPGQNPIKLETACTVVAIGKKLGVNLYLVGGLVRDAINCRLRPDLPAFAARDFDFAVLGMPALTVARAVADEMQGHYVELDPVNDVARVVIDDGPTIDFAGCQGGSLLADIQRRDFTVNAMALDPDAPDVLIDPTGGLQDLEAGVIRMVSEGALLDDPLRVLRAYRFACLLDFEIEEETRRAVAENVDLLEKVARERINYELFTMLDAPRVGRLIHEMGEIGLLEIIFAELRETRRVTANSYHHLPLFTHCLETIPQLEAQLGSMPAWARESLAGELIPSISRMAATKLAAILHDIGKPATWVITEEGKHTFIGHDKVGAEMIKVTAEVQKWPRNLARFIERMVLWHLRPGQLFHTGDPTQKALNRFYRTVGDELPELMLLAYGDLGATRGPGLNGPERDRLEKNLVNLLDGYAVFREETQSLPKLLSGQDIMQLLGIGPGPIVGEILQGLAEAQSLKEVVDRSQAEAFALSYQGKN